MRQPLKDLAAICAGQGAPQGDHNYCENGTPFVKAGNLQELLEGKAITSIQKVSDEVAKKHKLRLYPKGTILFAKSGMSCMKGYIYVLPQSAYVVSHLACITPNEDISEYLRYYFNYHKPNQLVKDAAYPSISLSDVGNLVVDMKPESERNEIVSVLQHTESIITLRQRQLQKLDELVKARFIELFGDPISNPKGWKKDKAESHIDLLSGYPFQSEQYVNDGINICGGLIIMPQKIQWQDCRHWPSVDGYEDYLLAEDDIVMALDRPWISEGFKIAQVDSTHLPALLIQRTARIRGIDVNQQYLFHCFVHGGFDKHSNVTGSLVPHISAKDIRSFEILLPPIKLQKQFAAFVKQVDKSKVAVQKALDEAQLLFDSLMQKYFG